MTHNLYTGTSTDLDESSIRIHLTASQLQTILISLGANSANPQGNNVQADHCFLHNNDGPTLGVSQDPPHSWNCFNPDCRKGLTILSLIAIARGTTKRQALAWLHHLFPDMEELKVGEYIRIRDRIGKKEERPPLFTLPKTVLYAYSLKAEDKIGYRAIDYWGKCTREQADEFRLGYDRKAHRIVFPVFLTDGSLGGLIGRCMLPNTPKEFRWCNYDESQFKKTRCVMGAELPLEEGPIVVVEGPSDYINLRAGGVKNVRSIMGSSVSQEQLEILLSYRRPIVPLLDIDKAGNDGRRKLTKMVNNYVPIWGFRYPQSAFNVSGEADPGNIDKQDMKYLVESFSLISRYRRVRDS